MKSNLYYTKQFSVDRFIGRQCGGRCGNRYIPLKQAFFPFSLPRSLPTRQIKQVQVFASRETLYKERSRKFRLPPKETHRARKCKVNTFDYTKQ